MNAISSVTRWKQRKGQPTSEVQENPQPTFGPHPDVRSNYNFKDEVQCLPFRFNLGDAPFDKEQQD